jgi:hypothetical protein
MSVCGARNKFELENVKFFENVAVSRANTLTEEGMLSAKVVPAPWVPLR